MQIDQIVWQIINQKHCAFKIKTPTQNFCRNQFNVTGLCNRSACPLANSNYATVKHEKGICYLYIKTIQRSHMPNRMWEQIQLDKNYNKALQQIDENLAYWPNFLLHKCKQRLTQLRQMLIRIRKLKLEGYQELVPIKQKAERRDQIREKKAEITANVESHIEKELLERLKEGIHGGIYNFEPQVFDKIMEDQKVDEQEQEEEIIQEDDEDEDQISENSDFIFDPNQLGDSDEDLDDFGLGSDDDEGQQFVESDEDDEGDDNDDKGSSQQSTSLKKKLSDRDASSDQEGKDNEQDDDEDGSNRQNQLKQKPHQKLKFDNLQQQKLQKKPQITVQEERELQKEYNEEEGNIEF